MQFLVEAELEEYGKLVDNIRHRESIPEPQAKRKADDWLKGLFDKALLEAKLGSTSDRLQPDIEPMSGVGDVWLSSAEDASRLADALMEVARKDDGRHVEAGPLRVGIHGGDAAASNRVRAALRALRSHAPRNGVIISEVAREHLPERLRSSYGDATSVADGYEGPLRAYRRSCVSEIAKSVPKRCFVIRPYKVDRSEEVLDLYVRPACAQLGLTVDGSEIQLSLEIIPELLRSLRESDVAVAYLGHPPWNANVMLEIGFRLAANRPLVFLRDRWSEQDAEMLPFDIQSYRVVELPSPSEEKRDRVTIENSVSRIAGSFQYLLSQPDMWKQPHATATARFNIEKGTNVYTESSPLADRLFGPLKKRTVTDFVEGLRGRMDPHQHEEFVAEQYKLFQEVVGLTPQGRIPIATVPIVLRDAPGQDRPQRRAYLPVIVDFWIQGGEVLLKILYLDVTAVVQKRRSRNGRTVLVAALEPVGDGTATSANCPPQDLGHGAYFAPTPLASFDGQRRITGYNVALRVLLGTEAQDSQRDGLPGLLYRLGCRSFDPMAELSGGRRLAGEFASRDFGKMAVEVFAVTEGNGGGYVFIDVVHVEHEEAFRQGVTREQEHQRTWAYYATSYDRVLPRLSYYKEVVRRHVAAMAEPAVSTVLDIGAGTGNVTVPLLDANRRVTAIDLSPAMLAQLRRKVRSVSDEWLTVIEQSAEQLSGMDDGDFDGVTILLALFDMNDPRRALDEAIRVLRPGGRLAITEVKRSCELREILRFGKAELMSGNWWPDLEQDWKRVAQANHALDPQARPARLFVEDIATLLKEREFQDLTIRDSHFGQGATILGKKPGGPRA